MIIIFLHDTFLAFLHYVAFVIVIRLQAPQSIVVVIRSLPCRIGDLAASAIKRNHKVKDYGHIIPGHGGILDRFDSMIFTAPAIYFVLTFLG